MTHEQTQQLCTLAQQHAAMVAFVKALIANETDQATVLSALDRVSYHLNTGITTVIASAPKI